MSATSEADLRGDLYGDLAPWFHLLTSPEDYDEEAAFTLGLLRAHVVGPLETLLELGSGGGNMASHLKRALRLTLTDLSPEMLALSAPLTSGHARWADKGRVSGDRHDPRTWERVNVASMPERRVAELYGQRFSANCEMGASIVGWAGPTSRGPWGSPLPSTVGSSGA